MTQSKLPKVITIKQLKEFYKFIDKEIGSNEWCWEDDSYPDELLFDNLTIQGEENEEILLPVKIIPKQLYKEEEMDFVKNTMRLFGKWYKAKKETPFYFSIPKEKADEFKKVTEDWIKENLK